MDPALKAYLDKMNDEAIARANRQDDDNKAILKAVATQTSRIDALVDWKPELEARFAQLELSVAALQAASASTAPSIGSPPPATPPVVAREIQGQPSHGASQHPGGSPTVTSESPAAFPVTGMTHASSTPVPDVSCSNIKAQEVLEVIHDAPLASIAMAHTTCSTECSTQVVAIARPRPWPWFKYHLDAGCLEEPCSACCCDMIPKEEPFNCLQNSYLATVAAHLFQSMQKMGALSIDYSNNIFVQFIHIGPYELVRAPAAVVYLFEDYLRPVNLKLPQEWPPLVKSNSSELCSFKLWSSMGLQLIQFEPLLSSGPTSITEHWQLNCDKHADVRTISWHEKLQWTVQIMSVSTHWQFLSQEEFKWNVQCRPEQLAGVLRARIQIDVLINFEYCSFKFRPDLILLVWPPARERTPEVKFSFAKALFADAHAQDIRSTCYMICRCTLSKFMRSPGYTAQPTFVVTKLQLTETLSLSSCRLWSEPPSKVIHRKKFNYKDLQSYSCYVLQSQAGTECLLHCNVSYEFYLQKFALVWKVDRSGSNNSALRVITSLVHIRNTCSFWNMLVLAWRSRRLSVEKLQGEIPSCDILVLTWLGSSTSYKSCACFTDNKSKLASSMLIQIELELLITPLGEHMPLLQPKPPWSPLVPPKFTSEFGSNMRTNSKSLHRTGVLLELSQFWVLADLISSSSNYWWRFSCGTHPNACLTIALDWFGYIINELLQEGMSWDFGSSATYCDLRAMNSSSHNCPSAFIVMRQFNYGLLSVFDLYLLQYSSCKFPCCTSEAFNSEGSQSNEQCAVKLVLPVLSSYEQWDPEGLKFGDVEENWHRLGGKPVVKGEGVSASLLSWADSYGLGPATSLPCHNNYKYQDRDTGRGIRLDHERHGGGGSFSPHLLALLSIFFFLVHVI